MKRNQISNVTRLRAGLAQVLLTVACTLSLAVTTVTEQKIVRVNTGNIKYLDKFVTKIFK